MPKDDAQAEVWYRRSADGGYGPSQYELGVRCGERKEWEQAVEWYKKAAEGGNSDAVSE